MAKRVSTRRIRKDRVYTYEAAGNVMGVTAQTVRAWRPAGLPVMTDRKPHYILGEALLEFHAARNTKRCKKMALDEMFCFSCRAPTKLFGAMVDYIPINHTRGRLTGLCEVCESPVQRFAKLSALPEFAQVYDVAIKSSA